MTDAGPTKASNIDTRAEQSALRRFYGLNGRAIVGIVNFLAQGQNLELREAGGTFGNQVFVGKWNIFGLQAPNHFFISLIWVAVMYVLFRYHRFGVRVQIVGDNPSSARSLCRQRTWSGSRFRARPTYCRCWRRSLSAAPRYGAGSEQSSAPHLVP